MVPECERADVAILLDTLVVGEFERDEDMKYRLSPATYERIKTEEESERNRVEVTRTMREETRETLLARVVPDATFR